MEWPREMGPADSLRGSVVVVASERRHFELIT